MRPNYEFTSFREKLIQIQGNKEEFLQQIILQQYSLDNMTIHQDNYKYNEFDALGIYQNQYLNKVYLTSKNGLYM